MEKEKIPDQKLEYRSSFRLLGACPNCQAEDAIIRPPKTSFEERSKVTCESCQTSWPDWLRLTWEEREKGNKLIPVEVERNRGFEGQEYGVFVVWPSWDREIPHCGLIASILNAAVITKFKMRVCFATEGGIEGVYKGDYIELRNSDRSLGLVVDQSYRQGKGLVEILDFYEKMLRLTFEEGFEIDQMKFRRGQILKLEPEDKTAEDAWKVLIGVLIKVGGKRFAQEVVKTVTDASPFSRPYFRGLTYQEIADRFVPPPGD